MTDIATLRALLDAATPGPWTHGPLGWEVWNRDADGAMDTRVAGSWLLPQDAALIVAAVNALPALLAVAEAALDAVAQAEHSTSGALWHYEVDALRAALEEADHD